MQDNRKRNRGSLTVEACVAFPVFLCFFLLLLFFVKLACVSLALDAAVNETAMRIASSAYPVAFLNEMEDSLLEEGGADQAAGPKEVLEKPPEYNGIGEAGDALSAIMTGNLLQPDMEGIIGKIAEACGNGVAGYFADDAVNAWREYKANIKYGIAKALMEQAADARLVNFGNMEFRLVKFPESAQAYAAGKAQYAKLGLDPEDIGQDDVAVQVAYRFDIPIPFFGSKNIRLVHTAVEKAWLKGSYGIVSENGEGLDLLETKTCETVYVTRTGKRYHRGDCRYLYASKIPMPIDQARQKGYTPCKVCKPPAEE